MLNICALTDGLEVLLVDLNVHAKDIALEPVEFLHLLMRNRATRCMGTRASISHKRTSNLGSRGSYLPLDISLLELVIHKWKLTHIFCHSSVIDKKLNVRSI
jgi:hypothetical protein